MTKNHGVILGRKKTDFAAGKIPYEVRNPSGDWSPFLVKFEKQWFPTFDTQACVSFSANFCMEVQIKQQTGIEVNFSDRFLAKMSGTTESGNWLYIVADTIRHVGVVEEDEWPIPPDPVSWNSYYSQVPMFVLNRTKGFGPQYNHPKYTMQDEDILDITAENIKYHLKHAPLQIVIPGHAVGGIALSINGDEVTYFDTYLNDGSPIKKTKVSNIQFIKKIVLTVKGKKMIGYKLIGNPTTYVLVGSILVPIADWKAFTDLGGSTASVVELTAEQFAKFTVATTVLFKLK